MLIEFLRHALTPCPPTLKRLGVLHDLIALDHRARRQASAWAPHRQACAQAILHMADMALSKHALAQRPALSTRRTTAVVIGSGLLLEVPLAELAARFQRVILVDLLHLPQVRRQAKAFPHVELISHDVTGLLDGVQARLSQAQQTGSLPQPHASFPAAEEADLLVSANCLSQLAGIPLAVAETLGGFTPGQLVSWERQIVRSHLTALETYAASGATVGLICDQNRQCVSVKDGTVLEGWDLLAGVPLLPLADESHWWWDLAPAPEENRRWSVRHQVVAGRVGSEDATNRGET